MREYKFRGKRKDINKWVYGNLIRTLTKVYILPEDWRAFHDVIEVRPETIGQYIEIKDKNGKDIYENDTVVHLGDDEAIIKWNNEDVCFEMVGTDWGTDCWIGSDIEVVEIKEA